MNLIYYSKIHEGKGGLTNQIFAFVTSILIANVLTHEKAVIYEDFLCDYKGDKKESISNIFDLDKMNVYLKKEFDVVIFDKKKVIFKINSVKYGCSNSMIDITKEVMNHFYNEKDNSFFISKSVDFNSIHGDPCPNIAKKLYVNYSLNHYTFEDVFDEDREKDISFNLETSDYKYTLSWINSHGKDIFDELLRHIYFTPKFYELSNTFLEDQIGLKDECNDNNNSKSEKKINVLHLRVEEDGAEHWGKMNLMEKNEFTTYIENKYIDIISKNINKTDYNILLSYSQNNRVIKYLEDNNYHYCFLKKDEKVGRETNAVIDLLISNACNNIFIGNFDLNKMWGSTFSYFIMSRLKPNVKVILINLDKIKFDEVHYLSNQIFRF